MLTHECSKSLPNAIIELIIIWILVWKPHLFIRRCCRWLWMPCTPLRPAQCAGRALTGASFGLRPGLALSLDSRRLSRRSLVGASTIVHGWFRHWYLRFLGLVCAIFQHCHKIKGILHLQWVSITVHTSWLLSHWRKSPPKDDAFAASGQN